MEIEVFGKWILAGEHAVVRGGPAMAFPLRSKSLKFRYEPLAQPLAAQFSGARGEELRLLFWGVWERALELVSRTHNEVEGRIHLENTLPVGAGMGASASLCVAVGRWFEWRGWIQANDVYEFARQLENLFHGESSGVDIAVALESQPVFFTRAGERRIIKPNWQPLWFLSYSGSRGVTSECVAQVQNWIRENPVEGQAVDQQMAESVLLCERALALSRSDGFELLTQAIRQARSCFERWNLTHGDVDQHMRKLEAAGAAAVKPTGSGNGGYVLSLWAQPPPAALDADLVPLPLT